MAPSHSDPDELFNGPPDLRRDSQSAGDSAELPLDDVTTDDLEAAYLRALESMESEDWVVGPDEDETSELDESDELAADGADAPQSLFSNPTTVSQHSGNPSSDPTPGYPAGDYSPPGCVHTEVSFEVHAGTCSGDHLDSIDNVDPNSQTSSRRSAGLFNDQASFGGTGDEVAGADFLGGVNVRVDIPAEVPGRAHHTGGPSAGGKSNGKGTTESTAQPNNAGTDAKAYPAPNATRIIEACLFVGGQPLSAKRLSALLESTADSIFIDQLVDDLNLEYASQQRPYEIRLGDGGYRIALRTEFEAVRNRVYGVGPREVKLSQDVLEVLALVAYQQPITHAAVEACGKQNVANILRQLLRRELITLTRLDQSRNGVEYRTSARFLQLFGLGNLNELPRPEDLALR